MLDEEQAARLRGATLVAKAEEVGEIEEIYTHSWDDRPALVAVAASGQSVLVPLTEGAGDDDARVEVSFDVATINDAPAPSGDTLTEDEFEAVYRHYGIDDSTMREDSGAFREGEQPSPDPRGGGGADDATQGHP